MANNIEFKSYSEQSSFNNNGLKKKKQKQKQTLIFLCPSEVFLTLGMNWRITSSSTIDTWFLNFSYSTQNCTMFSSIRKYVHIKKI